MNKQKKPRYPRQKAPDKTFKMHEIIGEKLTAQLRKVIR